MWLWWILAIFQIVGLPEIYLFSGEGSVPVCSFWNVQYVAQYPDTCYNFPSSVTRVLKFGPEEIHLVCKMTKRAYSFLLSYLSWNLHFCRALLCWPVSIQQAQFPDTTITRQSNPTISRQAIWSLLLPLWSSLTLDFENINWLKIVSVLQAKSLPKLAFQSWNFWLPFGILHLPEITKCVAKTEIVFELSRYWHHLDTGQHTVLVVLLNRKSWKWYFKPTRGSLTQNLIICWTKSAKTMLSICNYFLPFKYLYPGLKMTKYNTLSVECKGLRTSLAFPWILIRSLTCPTTLTGIYWRSHFYMWTAHWNVALHSWLNWVQTSTVQAADRESGYCEIWQIHLGNNNNSIFNVDCF